MADKVSADLDDVDGKAPHETQIQQAGAVQGNMDATGFDKDETGKVTCVHCTYDPATKSGSGFNERKPNGTIHYVEASTALKATFNHYEPLVFDETKETEGTSFLERINPNSLIELHGFVEASLKTTKPLDRYQFIRNGYYCTDKESKEDDLIFNRTCPLKSSFSN